MGRLKCKILHNILSKQSFSSWMFFEVITVIRYVVLLYSQQQGLTRLMAHPIILLVLLLLLCKSRKTKLYFIIYFCLYLCIMTINTCNRSNITFKIKVLFLAALLKMYHFLFQIAHKNTFSFICFITSYHFFFRCSIVMLCHYIKKKN